MTEYKILKDLVKINTIKDLNNQEIIEYIENILTKKGFKTEHKGKILIMSYGINPTFGFLGHTDTVEYIEGWNTNPFTLTQKDSKLYGLGVCDMKGGIAAVLDAISQTDLTKIQNGIKVYFTYDEEIGFCGINDIVNMGEVFPKFMVFGEPTYNEILIGSKGLLELELKFKGVKAHSSTPDKGKSANLNAVRFFGELEKFYLEKIKCETNEKFEIPYTTMNLGVLKGGSAINSIPAECSALLDFRVIDTKHTEMIMDKIKELSKKFECEYKVLTSIPPYINETQIAKEGKTANFMTEASFVKCDTKVILGVGPVTAHEVNEHIEKESYNKLVVQYKKLIETFA